MKEYKYVRLDNINNYTGWEIEQILPSKNPANFVDMCVMSKQAEDPKDQEIERLNNILDSLMQDMALLNATGVKEIKPKYVFDRIVMLREGVDKE